MDDVLRVLERGKDVIVIGDLVSYSLLERGYTPRVILFNEEEGNKPTGIDIREVILKYDATLLIAKNPPHHLTSELWNVIKDVLSGDKRVKIFIEGDETVALIPCIMESKEGTIILYGLKNDYVVVEVNQDLKEFCKSLLKKMVKKKVKLKGR